MHEKINNPNDKVVSEKVSKKERKIKELNCELEKLEALPNQVV